MFRQSIGVCILPFLLHLHRHGCLDNVVSSIRLFHSSPELLARRGNDELNGLMGPRKVKYQKKTTSTQPPVEAPYVPPRLRRISKSLPDKTIDIFDGMTLIELAKSSGESISDLENILTHVGETVDSEFDSLSIDVAELVAMVIFISKIK